VECWGLLFYAIVLVQYTVSNEVRSAAVNRPLGVDFNVIKVGCIHIFFRTISISTKV